LRNFACTQFLCVSSKRSRSMRIAPLLAASVVALGLSVAAGSPSQAAQISPVHQSQINQSIVQPVGYYWRRRYWRGGHCVRWRNICANRWGWGGWRFRRCMVRHGC
jgi:hypothetical protein